MKSRSAVAAIALAVILSLWAASCAPSGNAAVLWTDLPEFAVYAELFNASQNTYVIETRYFESTAERLTSGEAWPDLAAASWLKSASTRRLFQPLDSLFAKEGKEDDEGIDRASFYPRLLALGAIGRKQYLLPVSFNIPAIVFQREYGLSLSNPFTIELDEIKDRGKAYNQESYGVYTRMGFSPSWDDAFLYTAASLFNASFREAAPGPLAWDEEALEEAMTFLRRWTEEANAGAQAEDDFTFKYLYDPPSKLALSGRILFTYMESDSYFTLAEERRSGLDFRWIAGEERIPLSERTVYLGMCKNTRNAVAAMAFIRWFFRLDTQRALLEYAGRYRMSETSFGVAGGFSAMRTVTEQAFPRFYGDLLGRMPPEAFLTPANILPRNWTVLKEKVILPYLRDRSRLPVSPDSVSLDRRLYEWTRLNR